MRGKKLLAVILSLGLVFSMGLTGCGSESTPTSNDTTKTEKDKEQQLTLFLSEPNTLDPQRCSIDTAWFAQAPICEGLTRVESDDNGNTIVKPGVAEKWEANDKGDVYTFHLRKNAKWSDGSNLTAKDFVYSFRRLVDPATGSEYNAFLNPYVKNAQEVSEGKASIDTLGVTAVDEYTLKIELINPTPYFLELSYFPVLKPTKKEAVEKSGDKYGAEAETVIGNGPFVIKKWVHNGELNYEKNPNYWDKDNVSLEKLTFKIVDDRNSALNALFNGEIDAGRVLEEDWKKKFDATGEYDFITIKDAGCEFALYNFNDKYFKNEKIRKAFSVAFDREDYVKLIDKGASLPAYEYIPDTIAVGKNNFREKSGNVRPVKDLIAATKDPKALLIEGLKEIGEDPDPAKMQVKISLRGTTEYVKRQADWFIENYKKNLGVTVTTDMQQTKVFYDALKKGEFQIGIGGWGADFNDPATFMDLWLSKAPYYPGAGVKISRLDEIIEKCSTLNDQEERAKLYKEAEDILVNKECVIIPITHGKGSTYQRKYVKNMMRPVFGFFDYKNAYTSGRK